MRARIILTDFIAMITVIGCGNDDGLDALDPIHDVAGIHDSLDLDSSPDEITIDQSAHEINIDSEVPGDDIILDEVTELNIADVGDATNGDLDSEVGPACPCAPPFGPIVCGCDEIEYLSPFCAACALCMDVPPNPPLHNGCVGCTGILECDLENPLSPCQDGGYIIDDTGGGCNIPVCNEEYECARALLAFPCGPVCGMGPDEIPNTPDDTTFETLCDMFKAYDASQIYLDYIAYIGECV